MEDGLQHQPHSWSPWHHPLEIYQWFNYSASSAYKIKFEGILANSTNKVIWKTWAPLKCSFLCMVGHAKYDLDSGLSSA
jgi:hypothetical protein